MAFSTQRRKNLWSFAAFIVLTGSALTAQMVPDAEGRLTFEKNCAKCHGADGNGGDMGPAITSRLLSLNNTELSSIINKGIPERGMPPVAVPDKEMPAL